MDVGSKGWRMSSPGEKAAGKTHLGRDVQVTAALQWRLWGHGG